MEMKYNLSQLAEQMAQVGGMSKTASEQFVKSFFDTISKGVLTEGLVKVKGLGTFKLLKIEDRESVNVNTGERFTIEGHQKISFTPDAELKELINKPFASFETVVITEEQANDLAKMDTQTLISEDTDNDVESESEETVVPMVRDITQGRGVRFLLKLLVWILSLVLILAFALFMFWPLIGTHVLGFMENKLNLKEKTELVTDTVRSNLPPVQPVKPVLPVQSVQPVRPVQDDVPVESTNSGDVVVSTPETVIETESDKMQVRLENDLQLNSQDQAKSLLEFTEADTVNYRIEGVLTVHTLKNGETITRLALKYYGTKKLWPYIVKFNDIKDSGKLVEGTKIRIPVLKAK